jgi:hypothetical protein
VADLLLASHVCLELVHRHVPRSLDHDLHALRPGALGELTQGAELGELRRVGRIGDRAGTQAVAERDGDVVSATDGEHLTEALVERVLCLVVDHPAGEQPAAAGNDSRDSVLAQRQMFEPHAGVDGHVVHALARLALDHL